MKISSKKMLLVVIVILLILSIYPISIEDTVNSNEMLNVRNKQLTHDTILIEKNFAESKYKISVQALTPVSDDIVSNFPEGTNFEERVEFVKKLLSILSENSINKRNKIYLNSSKVTEENSAIVSSSFFTYNNPLLFQTATLHPLVAFIYTGPTKHYRINRTYFHIYPQGLYAFSRIPYGYKVGHGVTTSVQDFKDISSAPSCIIFHYAPITFRSFKFISIGITAGMYVNPGTAGITRGEGPLNVKRFVP